MASRMFILSGTHWVGHSLGGGMASAAAIVTGGRATTYNAAGVHGNTVGRVLGLHGGYGTLASVSPGQITAYMITGEAVSHYQDCNPALPDTVGDKRYVDLHDTMDHYVARFAGGMAGMSGSLFARAVARHGIANFFTAWER
jgi:hypothetical protein